LLCRIVRGNRNSQTWGPHGFFLDIFFVFHSFLSFRLPLSASSHSNVRISYLHSTIIVTVSTASSILTTLSYSVIELALQIYPNQIAPLVCSVLLAVWCRTLPNITKFQTDFLHSNWSIDPLLALKSYTCPSATETESPFKLPINSGKFIPHKMAWNISKSVLRSLLILFKNVNIPHVEFHQKLWKR
jgi:hypothetical protein